MEEKQKERQMTGFDFRKEAEGLLDFIDKSPTVFHTVANAAAMLDAAGFCRLAESGHWELSAGKKYYVTRNGSSLIAFTIPGGEIGPFRLFCSHNDSPTFKVKVNAELEGGKAYTKLNVEQYGGALRAPWFDRPLSVAGRVLVQNGTAIETKLICIDRDLLMIPSVAIHMNRDANEGASYNVQNDMCPVFGDADAKGGWKKLIAQEAGVDEEQVLDMDLFLYNRQHGTFVGLNEEYLAAPRLDDLQCMYGSLRGFLKADAKSGIPVYCAFDNEETGSVSRQGAASTFLHDVLVRICAASGGVQEDYLRAVAGSFMISGDNAHAVHPSHPEKADPVNRPQMNQGVVVKFNANQKYTSDARSGAVLRMLCARAGVPCQNYTNRSDMAGGSTLGNISNTQVSLQAVDIGMPQLAMHSSCEMAGAKDTAYLAALAKEFFEAKLVVTDEEIRIS